jgi:hypothetical protein
MQRRDALRLIAGFPMAACAAGWPRSAQAQVTRGFNQRIYAVASGEELQRQPDLWIFELHFKPMRMIFVNTTDPGSGETSREQIWYLAYRAANRSLSARQDESDTAPVNELDPLPGPPQFIPEFTLSVYDQPDDETPQAVALDEVIPEAIARVNEIELRRPDEPRFLNSVDIVQPLPESSDPSEDNPAWIYGAATWRNINPETDFFTVTMRGFSNGYELREGPQGSPIVWRRTIIQKFSRRGDRFDPTQTEFEFNGDPQWIYLPDPSVPGQAQPAQSDV